MLRPSTSASCEVASVDVAPRVVTLTSRAETCVTFMPGTARSRSPMFVAGEFAIVWYGNSSGESSDSMPANTSADSAKLMIDQAGVITPQRCPLDSLGRLDTTTSFVRIDVAIPGVKVR